MSVLNVFVDGDGILCLTDTLVYCDDVAVGLVDRKCVVAENGAFALGIRGTMAFADAVADTFRDAPAAADVEFALSAAAGRMDRRCFEASGGDVVVMSWCREAREPRATRFNFARGDGSLAVAQLQKGMTMRPDIPGAKLPQAINDHLMVKVALGQHRVASHFGFPMCIGGVMHLTTVSRDGADQRIVGAYPDYEQHARQFGCPNAAAYRQWLEAQKAVA